MLKYLRQRARLTQLEFGLAVGYGDAQINRLERNVRLPDIGVVIAQFIPALHLEDEPQVAARLIELAAQARGEPVPASITYSSTITSSSQQRREFVEAVQVKVSVKRRTNLPAAITHFIGREREVAEVRQLLRENRIVTLTGAGGVGKTRLAQAAAAAVLDTYVDGVWWVELAALADPAFVPNSITSILKLTNQPGRVPLESVSDYFEAKHTLLILDNCEHLIGTCAEVAAYLLQHCPQLSVLATSRETLRVIGEVVYRVPSLTIPQSSNDASNFGHYESVRLFVERAHIAQPQFALTANNVVAVARMCQRLDGIPLALELAAAHVKVLSVEQIAARLEQGFDLLAAGNRTALPRQQTLKATMDWSHDLLSESERALFQSLSVFAGSFSLDAAQAIGCVPAEEDEARGESVLALLTQLIDKSLVVAMHDDEPVRYRLLEPIRQYASALLKKWVADEKYALRYRFVSFFLALAEEAEPKFRSGGMLAWLNKLDPERDNFRVAIDLAYEIGETTLGLRLVAALNGFWHGRNDLHELRGQLLRALAMSKPTERTILRATLLNKAFYIQWIFKNYQEAHGLLEEACAIGMELEDERTIAASFLYLQYEAFANKDFIAARLHNEKALAAWRELGDKYYISHVLSLGGDLARMRGDYDQAQNAYKEAISLLTELGETQQKGVTIRRWGRLLLELGNYTKADALCRQSLALSLGLRDQREVASVLAMFAGLAVAQGQQRRAAQFFGIVATLLTQLGVPMLFGDVYTYEDDLCTLQNQLDATTFDAAFAAGQAMTFEEAVAYALQVSAA